MVYDKLFLACFLACTFSFVVFGVAGYQIFKFLVRRWMKISLPKVIHSVLGGQHGALDPFSAGVVTGARTTMPPEFLKELMTAKCVCGREQALPPTNGGDFLREIGWTFDEDGVEEPQWLCPFCGAKSESKAS